MAEPTSPPIVPARLVRATWALVGVLTVASVAGTAASPLLLVKAPLLLVALAPDGRHVALAAGRVDPLLLLAVGVARQSLYGLGVYGLGAIYGDLAVRWVEARARRLGRALRALERLFERVGALLLLGLPLLAVCVLAGAARVRWIVVVPALVLGHCLWTGISFWLGTHFAEQNLGMTHLVASLRSGENQSKAVGLLLDAVHARVMAVDEQQTARSKTVFAPASRVSPLTVLASVAAA